MKRHIYLIKDIHSEHRKNSYNSKNTDNPIFEKGLKYVNRHLTKEDTQMASKHKKRCSSLVISESQIKTTMTFHNTFTKKAIIKNTIQPSAGEDMEKMEPLYVVGGNI